MSDILNRIAICVEAGKINKSSSCPPAMKDQDGADFYSPDPQEAVNYLNQLGIR